MKQPYLIQSYFLPILVLLTLFYGKIDKAYATHSMGANLTYTCTGPNQYRVTLTFFRDCSGILPLSTQTLAYSSASCGVSSNLILTQPTGGPIDVTPICPSQTSLCAGGTSPFGIQQYSYSGTLNLPAGCGNDWILGWTNCCRNFAITTLNGPGNQDMFISTTLDNTISPCNNSPVFNNIPTPIVCINQPVIYNHGVTDPDGDSLVFSLVECAQSVSVPVNYAAGFSAANPLLTASGISLNVQTGEINFTPNAVQIGVICVQVDEYRGGVKIGETVRDMQFSVINCNNSPPIATGINGNVNTFDISACIGGNVCFDIFMSDPDGDNVTATWNNGIPNGIFTIAGNGGLTPTGTFCWSPTPVDIGSHFFTVTVVDDNCPLSGSATYAFTVNVQATTNNLTVSPNATICQGGSTNLSASGPGAFNFIWSPTTGLSNPNIANPIADPAVTTVYTVSAEFPDGCTSTGTVTVDVSPGPTISVSPAVAYACPGGNVTLTANSPTATSYLWSTTSNLPSIVVSPTTTTTYSVTATDANTCTATADVTVNVNTPGVDLCDVIYASPTGTGAGTRADPASLLGAISQATCNNVVIKLAIGTYNIDNAVTSILGNITLEGGFDPGNNWSKTSLPGATTIHRSALNPDVLLGTERLVAFQIANASDFRFQDITITTADASTAGMATYGVHLMNCSNYQFVRCQINPGDAGNGLDGVNGLNGNNGVNGTIGFAGRSDDKDEPGEGGIGGNGAGAIGTFGIGGAGGIDVNGPTSCCLPGDPGNDGGTASNARSGHGGGGGAAGGEADNDGGDGGDGGGVSGGTGGNGGAWGDPGANGGDGNNGPDGGNGLNGLMGSAGFHVGGFWVIGTPGGDGGDGEGGFGGGGGGGGGGQTPAFIRGAGSGGGGGGGGGEGGSGGTGGTGGGSSYGVYIYNNGAGGAFISCDIQAGNFGTGGSGGIGGVGGTGGTGGLGSPYRGANGFPEIGAGGDGGDGGDGGLGGNGGDGADGESVDFRQNGGQPPLVTEIAFNLTAQAVIEAENVSCINTDMDYTAAVSNVWDLGTGASPQIIPGATVTTQYSSTGRKDVSYGADNYIGFTNIILSDGVNPDAGTNAPLVGGEYRICEGSQVDFSALNGATGYTFLWDMGGGSAGPNNYNGTTFNSLTNIAFNTPGTYYIQLQYQTDCCGLSTPDTITLIVDPQPVLAITGPGAFCAGAGGVTLNASGGVTYDWGPATGLSTNTGATVLANPTTTTTYTVTAYNSAGNCYDTDNVTVTVNDVQVSASAVDQGCTPDGTATAFPSGGSGTYTYAWNTAPVQNSGTATALSSGTYSVVVTDVITGCIDSAAVFVGVAPGTLNSIVSNSVPATCNGISDGTATIATSGGSGSYGYAWTPSGGTGATETGLAAGTYSVVVTDLVSTCQTTVDVTIPEPAPLNIAVLNQTTPDCNTYGTALVNASGGNGPFTYTWNTSPPQIGNTATGLEAASYWVHVSDQDGCLDSLQVTVPGPQSPVSMSLVNATDATACTIADGQATVAATGSNGNITYEWQTVPIQTGATITGLLPGFYNVIATGANGCTDNIGVNIGPSCPLDVAWLSFNARPVNRKVELDWLTQKEEQNTGFEVERSDDKVKFEVLDWVESGSVAGGGYAYSYEDKDVMPGKRYFYRLKAHDVYGSVQYSSIEEVLIPESEKFQVLNIYPVPAYEILYIEIYLDASTEIELDILNSLGQKIDTHRYQLAGGPNKLLLDIKTWAAGVYVGRLSAYGEVQTALKLVKSE